MGLFDFFKKRKIKEDLIFEEDEQKIINENEKIEFSDKSQREQYVFEKCEQILENSKQMEDAKIEYELVTSYLTDIQQIESIPEQPRNELNSLAGKIDELQEQRKEFHDVSAKLSQVQFSKIRTHDAELPEAIDRLKANEAYQAAVNRDIHCLEGEKGDLFYQIKHMEEEQDKLKKMAFIAPVLLIILAIVTFIIQSYVRWNLQIVYYILLFFATLSGAFIFTRMQKISYELKKIQSNINYAIVLLNRAKIKYVNETNAVEYAYEKFGVNSAYELSFLWEEYLKAKEEREKLHRSTDDLDYYSNRLIHELCKYNIEDANIWANQVKALLDEREMVEIRHDLNSRRQKLRSRIEYNSHEMNQAKTEVVNLVKQYPKYSKEILEIVKSIDSLNGI